MGWLFSSDIRGRQGYLFLADELMFWSGVEGLPAQSLPLPPSDPDPRAIDKTRIEYQSCGSRVCSACWMINNATTPQLRIGTIILSHSDPTSLSDLRGQLCSVFVQQPAPVPTLDNSQRLSKAETPARVA
jgi:hypothetical protein